MKLLYMYTVYDNGNRNGETMLYLIYSIYIFINKNKRNII